MKLLEFDDYELTFQLEHRERIFTVQGTFLGDGRLIFEPVIGWDDLAQLVQQDIEGLYEEVDEAIYNAVPSIFDYVPELKEYDPDE